MTFHPGTPQYQFAFAYRLCSRSPPPQSPSALERPRPWESDQSTRFKVSHSSTPAHERSAAELSRAGDFRLSGMRFRGRDWRRFSRSADELGNLCRITELASHETEQMDLLEFSADWRASHSHAKHVEHASSLGCDPSVVRSVPSDPIYLITSPWSNLLCVRATGGGGLP